MTRIFYKYFVLKHSSFFFTISLAGLSHSLSSVTSIENTITLSYSPTAVKRHKMYRPCKHFIPQYIFSVRPFPASKTAMTSNHREKRKVKNTQSTCIGHFYCLVLFCSYSCVTHTHTHTQYIFSRTVMGP